MVDIVVHNEFYKRFLLNEGKKWWIRIDFAEKKAKIDKYGADIDINQK